MIFKGGYGRFFARTQIKSGKLTFMRSFGWAIISSVMTIVAYYGILLLTRENEDALPMCFHTSTFGLLFLYTILNLIIIFLVLLININFVRFPEIASNKWNLMTSMGIPISRLVISKVGSSVFALVRQYFIGYILVIGCGFLVKLSFSVNYLLALFFTGCILHILMCIIAQALAVFVKWIDVARVMMFFSFCITQLFMVFFKVYHKDMFQTDILIGWFTIETVSMLNVFAAIFVFCYAVILFRASGRTKHQELMPLDVFDIKPLLSDNAEELYTTEGIRNTTIFDVDVLKDSPEYQAPAEKPVAFSNEEGSEGFAYKLLAALSSLICLLSASILVISAFIPNLSYLIEDVFGESLSISLMSKDGRILMIEITAVFLVLLLLFIILGKRKKRIQQ